MKKAIDGLWRTKRTGRVFWTWEISFSPFKILSVKSTVVPGRRSSARSNTSKEHSSVCLCVMRLLRSQITYTTPQKLTCYLKVSLLMQTSVFFSWEMWHPLLYCILTPMDSATIGSKFQCQITLLLIFLIPSRNHLTEKHVLKQYQWFPSKWKKRGPSGLWQLAFWNGDIHQRLTL